MDLKVIVALRLVHFLEQSKEKELLIQTLSGLLTEEELRAVLEDYPIDLDKEDIDSYDTELRGNI